MAGYRLPMPNASRQRGTRLTSADRREQILIGAQQLFATRPYEEVSTTELAEAAGTSRTNLHHHFGTKRALYLAVVHRFARFPMPPPISTESGDIEDEVSQTFKGWLDLVEQNKETYLSMIGASLVHRDPEVDAVLRKGMQSWENRLLSVLRAPLTELNRAQIRAFQSLLSTATDEWLRSESLSRSQVHELLNRTLLALPMELPTPS